MGKKRGRESGTTRVIFLCLLVVTSLAAAQETQKLPSAPEPANPQSTQSPPQQKKSEGSDANGIAAQSRRMTLGAATATSHLGEKALVKARDWESGWFTGVFVPRGEVLSPLTAVQRREYYLQQTLATPGAYTKRMFAAGIDQARGSPPQWQGGIGGYGERFASREGQFISANTLAFLGNAALGYEPRYDQCQCSGLWPRARHAILRNFVTYNHSEQELRPQFGLYAGSFAGGLISTAWKPRPRNAFAEGGRAMLGQAAYGTLLNLFIEFAGDINRKIGADRKQARK